MSTIPAISSKEPVRHRSGIVNAGDAGSRRWMTLAVICTAALMIVLDVTVMTLALPSASTLWGSATPGGSGS